MRIDFIKPFRKVLPEITPAEGIPSMSERLMWVGLALVIYFLMYNTIVIGVKPISEMTGELNFLSAVTASRMGSLLTTGIGPIVLGSIFLQLFMGAGIFEVDMSNPEDRRNFFTFQKVLAIILAFVEAFFFTVGKGFFALQTFGIPGSEIPVLLLVTVQIAAGSIILMYLDEIIQKRGIGSGISLFIAAGVSFMVVSLGLGLLSSSLATLLGGAGGGSEAIPSALIILAPFVSTAIVFLVVVYAEGLKVDIPLVFGQMRGMDTVHSIPLLYVSNIPVILTAALLMNVQVVANVFPSADPNIGNAGLPPYDDFVQNIIWTAENNPTGLLVYNVGGNEVTNSTVGGKKQFADGLLYLLTSRDIVPGYDTNIGSHIDTLLTGSSQVFKIPLIIHLIVYLLAYILLSVMFGIFWVETASMSAKDVAKQLFQYGLHIPGMRRDPRIIERTLDKYIPTITIIGSAFVGMLAAFANITGALGTGTGILLTVMILHRLYQQLDQMGAFRFVPILGTIFGGK
ncbi:preprotein translocase subunit SecY [Candidatus Micrarchaeota archaeon]|nr:preprotein translocase subunit SecY [Candidatus Micrarchaeota archaeon]